MKKGLIIGVGLLLLSGCATIVGDKVQVMPISSTPGDASVMIKDEKGVEVFQGKTPTTVTLQKSDGSYFGGKSYMVTISKPGFQTQNVPIKASPNGWYLAGNLVFGGIIGWLIVDPLNGAMYTLKPEMVKATLADNKSASASVPGISIVLMQDVPANMRKDLVRVN